MSARKVLSTKEAGPYIGVAYSTLCKWRVLGEGPKHHRLGKRRVGYLIEELDRWLADRVRSSTSDRHEDDRGPSTDDRA